MLKTFRKKGFAKKVIWFIAIAIIVSFGFMGTAYLLMGSSGPKYAGEIYGKKIDYDDFFKLRRYVDFLARVRLGDRYFKVIDSLNLTAETWDRLILLQETKERKFVISDEEVYQAISNSPLFQKDGLFDLAFYQQILKSNSIRIPQHEYEEHIRDDMKISRIYEQETSTLSISEEDVYELYKNRYEKVQVSYILLSPDQYKEEAHYDEAQAQDYYANNKIEFQLPPSINVKYLHVPFIDSTDENVKDQVRQKAEEVFQELLVNPNFETSAQKHGLEILSSGFFSMQQPDLSLGWGFPALKMIFQLEDYEISEPFETAKGINIAVIDKRQDSSIPPYEEVKEQAKDAVLTINAKEIANKKAAEHLSVIREQYDLTLSRENFVAIAKELGLQILQTPPFARGQYLPKIGLAKDFQTEAFKLTDNQLISNVVETDVGYCILHLDTRTPAIYEEFAKQKEQLTRSLFNQRGIEIFNNFLGRLRIKANLIDNVSR